MHLTPLEREILNHRLEVPDAIADAIEQPDDAVYDVCQQLLSGEWPDSELAREVLIDAVEGSTYYGAGIDEASDQKQAAVARAGERLAEKIGQFVGREIVFPLY